MPYIPTPIPCEIWQEIFRIATGVSDSLVCFAHDYHGLRRDPAGQPYKRYKGSLATKVAICCVSRNWHAIATPLLYERIIMARPKEDPKSRRREIEQLIRTVGDSPSLPELSGPAHATRTLCLGAFVRRLDFTFPEGPEGTEYSEENVSRALVRLAKKLPNLQVFGLRTSSGVSPLETLEALSQKLKHLHWRTTPTAADFKIPIAPFLSFLEAHPSLETIQVMYNFEDIAQEDTSSFWETQPRPPVRHWVLRQNQAKVLPDVPATTLPKLEMVTYPYYPRTRGDNLERFTKFVSIHGARLKTIRVSPHTQLKDVLEAAEKWCPRLTEMQLVFKHSQPRQATLGSVEVEMPRVTTLGLSLYNYDEKNHTPGWQRVVTLPWKHLFPNLRTLKLLGAEDVESLKGMAEECERIISHCQECGIDLWDDSGQLLTLGSIG